MAPEPLLGTSCGPPTHAAEIQWIVHPVVQESLPKSVALILIIASVGILVSLSFSNKALGLLSVLILAASQSRYFFPSRYAIDPTGVTISHLASRKEVEWNRFKRIVVTEDGVFLSPFSKPHRLDSFRGIYLRCVGNYEEVVALVQQHFGNRSA